jgi:hypothetical protein
MHEYHITGATEDVTAEVRLEGTTQPWRPQTGHLLFGADGETIFGWTPFVPFGTVTATYRVGSECTRPPAPAIMTTTGWTSRWPT